MVRIPSAEDLGIGGEQTQPLSSAYFNIRAAETGQVGRYMQEAGNAFASLAQEVARRRTDTALREEQALLDEFEMNMLNPRTGPFGRSGSAANGLTNDVEGMFQNYLNEAEERLRAIGSASGRSAVLNLISGVRSRMYRRAAQYEMQQLEAASRAAAARSRSARAATAGHNFLDVDGRESALIAAAAAAGEESPHPEGSPEYVHDVTYATGEVWGNAIDAARNANQHEMAAELLNEGVARGQITPAYAASITGDIQQDVVRQRGEREAQRALALGAGMTLDAFTGTDPYEFVSTVMPAEMFNANTQTTRTIQYPGQGGSIERPRVITTTEDLGGGGDTDALDPRGEAYLNTGPSAERQAVEANVAAVARIDAEIDQRGMMNLGYTRDGLRAMIAYGGLDMTITHLITGGAVNPVTSSGMTLSEVYSAYTPTPGAQTSEGYVRVEEYFDTIADPEVRAAAREAYQNEVQADMWARERQQEQFFEEAVSAIDALSRERPDRVRNTRFEDLFSVEELDAMGPTNRALLRERFERVRTGLINETSSEAYNALIMMASTNEEQFARVNLEKDYGHLLNDADMREMVTRQASILGQRVADAEAADGGFTPMPMSDLRDIIGGATVQLDSDVRPQIEHLVHSWVSNQMRSGNTPSDMQIYDYAMNFVSERMQRDRLLGQANLTAEQIIELDERPLEDLFENAGSGDYFVTVDDGPRQTQVQIRERDLREHAVALHNLTGRPPRPSQVLSDVAFIEATTGRGLLRRARPIPRGPAPPAARRGRQPVSGIGTEMVAP